MVYVLISMHINELGLVYMTYGSELVVSTSASSEKR